MNREYGTKERLIFLKEEIDWETRMTLVGDALGRERAWERIKVMNKELNELENVHNSKYKFNWWSAAFWILFGAVVTLLTIFK